MKGKLNSLESEEDSDSYSDRRIPSPRWRDRDTKREERDSYFDRLRDRERRREESDSYSEPLIPSSWRRDRDRDRKRDPYRKRDSYSPRRPPNPNHYSPAMGSVEIKDQESSVEIKDEEIDSSSVPCCRICLETNAKGLISPCMCKGSQQFVHRSCLDHWRSVKEGFAFSHCMTCRAQYHLQINFLEGHCWRNVKFRMFVARDVFLIFLAIQTVICMLGGITYLCDQDGKFRKSFGHGWDRIFSNHPLPFYYIMGAFEFLLLLGIYGLIQQCLSCCPSDSYSSGPSSRTVNYGYDPYDTNVGCCNGPCIIDLSCLNDTSSSGGDDFCAGALARFLIVALVLAALVAVFGLFYGIFVASIGVQRIWQKHYHILTKRELTEEYVVEDLHGHYTPPKLDREHEERLRTLRLL